MIYLNQLGARTVLAINELLHVSSVGGLDGSITVGALRENILVLVDITADYTVSEDADAVGKLQLLMNRTTSNYTVTLGTSGQTSLMRRGSSLIVMYDGSSIQTLGGSNYMYSEGTISGTHYLEPIAVGEHRSVYGVTSSSGAALKLPSGGTYNWRRQGSAGGVNVAGGTTIYSVSVSVNFGLEYWRIA